MNLEEYGRDGLARYEAFAKTVASLLHDAICAEGGFRLQHVASRGKSAASLRKKLVERGLEATENLESEIKDLAGCRAILYTNSDVTRLTRSGIISEAFEVLDVKLHHPGRTVDDPKELYVSNHYIVRLHSDRTLPNLVQFADMRCEIQVQTILHHAWAEMAHGTIYKAPLLEGFGEKAFNAIRERMRNVANKYLVPAGYEFQKIASDFQRLVEGKALFDGDALEAIVEANDNNLRSEALDTFADHVLPLYDDPASVFPDVVKRLVEASDRARAAAPVPIETPYGTVVAKTFGDIVSKICEILTAYRYLDVAGTFDALRTLYGWAQTEKEQKPLMNVAEALAKHDLAVWRLHGPVVQGILVDKIEGLSDEEKAVNQGLLNAMLRTMLGTQISGTTNSSSAVTLHHAAAVASTSLREMRSRAVALLKQQFALANDDVGRRTVLSALNAATSTPFRGGYSNELAGIVMEDTVTVINFETEVLPLLSLDLRRQAEARIHRHFWNHEALPPGMREDPRLEALRSRVQEAAITFRDVANADADFVRFKTLVGFDSVFPPAWNDKRFQYEEAKEYRKKNVDAILATVDERDIDVWYERLNRYAQSDGSDLATFPFFGDFLARLAEMKPSMAFGFIDRGEAPLSIFLPALLAGLMRSGYSEQARKLIETWIDAGDQLSGITHYLRFADPFDEPLLLRAANSAIRADNRRAMCNAVLAADFHFGAHPGTLIDGVLLPAVSHLGAAGDFSWVQFPWHGWIKNAIVKALAEPQAQVVLDALVSYPQLENNAEYIAAGIAQNWPGLVIDFIGRRQALARSDSCPPQYDAVPFQVDELRAPLAAVPDLFLKGARSWFDSDPDTFPYDGGQLVASVFPVLADGLEPALTAFVEGGKQEDLAFVLAVLSGYKGQAPIYSLIRSVVAKLEQDSRLLSNARSALFESDVVRGEYGHADLYTERKNLLAPWLADDSEEVRAFALGVTADLDRWIAAENRSAQASIAMQRLEYGEEPREGH